MPQPGSARGAPAWGAPSRPRSWGPQPGSAPAAAAEAVPELGGWAAQPGSAPAALAEVVPELGGWGAQPGSAPAAGAEAAAPPPELGGWGVEAQAADMASYEAAAGQYYGEGGMAGYADGATAGYADYTAGGGADYSAEAAATAPEYAPAGSAQAAGWAQAAGDAGEQSGLEQQSEPAAPPLSPASHLEQLEQQQVALAEQKEQTEVQLVQAATVAYQQASAKLGPDSTGVALPAELPLLVEELSVLQAARQYLAYLQELQALTRQVEKGVSALERAAGEGDGAALVQSASEATDTLSHAVGYVLALQQLAAEGRVPAEGLQQYGAGLEARVGAAQGLLHTLLSQAIQARLAAASWPPPLSATGGEGGGGEEAGAGWPGFAAAPGGEAALTELQQLAVPLLTLQRVVQHAEFAALAAAPEGLTQEGPVLWIAEELAAPLAARLRHHFAEGLPTDRADKPEWLFATVLRAARQLAPHAQAFQPAVEAHQLEAWYSMPLEMARATQTAALAPILTSHVLPRLAASADPALWLHYADEAMSFERSSAPLRGSVAALPGEEDFLSAAHPSSAIELLFSSPEWEAGWLEAEHWDASRQLEAAVDAYTAWQPAALALGALGVDDLIPETPRGRDDTASKHEFWPPACAEQLSSLVGGLVRRGGWVGGQAHRLAFMRAVPLAVLRAFRDRLASQLQTAEQFRDVLGEIWLPKVGAAICAAHFTEHHVREPQGVLLLAELQDATAGGTPGTARGHGQAAAATPRSSAGLAPLLEREAAAFGALRKQWAYKVAKAAADAFHTLFAPYRRDLAAFSGGYEEEAAHHYQPAGAAPPGVSRAMLVAADGLQQRMRALAQHLDAVVFRDVWRSVALSVNYSLFNDVATEALFSQQGAAQLQADVSSVVAVFGEHTSRPAAHFKETREACRLLTLSLPEAVLLAAALGAAAGRAGSGGGGAEAARAALAGAGIKVLSEEQAACVLGQRLDLLQQQQQRHRTA